MRSPADILSDSESIRVRIPSLPYESKYFLTGELLCCIIQKDRHLVMLLALFRNRPNADYSLLTERFNVSSLKSDSCNKADFEEKISNDDTINTIANFAKSDKF